MTDPPGVIPQSPLLEAVLGGRPGETDRSASQRSQSASQRKTLNNRGKTKSPPRRRASEAPRLANSDTDHRPKTADRAKQPDPTAPALERKSKESHWVEREDYQRFRNAMLALSGPPWFYNLSDGANEAFLEMAIRLEEKFNDGKPFKHYDRPFRTGRPPKLDR